MNMENFDDVIFDDDEFGELPSEQENKKEPKIYFLLISNSLLVRNKKI